jgi:hypothetical protein
MKMIKKYWALIIGGILALLGLTAYFGKKVSKNKTDKIDDAIDQNNKQIDINAGKIDAIEDIKQDIKQDVIEIKEEITDLKQKKQNISTKKPKSVKAAKDNILSKTTKKKTSKKK